MALNQPRGGNLRAIQADWRKKSAPPCQDLLRPRLRSFTRSSLPFQPRWGEVWYVDSLTVNRYPPSQPRTFPDPGTFVHHAIGVKPSESRHLRVIVMCHVEAHVVRRYSPPIRVRHAQRWRICLIQPKGRCEGLQIVPSIRRDHLATQRDEDQDLALMSAGERDGRTPMRKCAVGGERRPHLLDIVSLIEANPENKSV